MEKCNASSSTGEITRLLGSVGDGGDAGKAAMTELLPLIYDELHSLAASYLSRERVDHTLQPTALVNEAYLKLVDQTRAKWESRGHFLAIAATAMRRILVNHARDRRRLKRGGSAEREPLPEDGCVLSGAGSGVYVDLIALDEALEKLDTIDKRKVRIVEQRFFVGLTVDETAALLGVSPSTVKREWEFARAWLMREMSDE